MPGSFFIFSAVQEHRETSFSTERSARILNERSLDNRIGPRNKALFTFI
jgi:hypothetical protein